MLLKVLLIKDYTSEGPQNSRNIILIMGRIAGRLALIRSRANSILLEGSETTGEVESS